MHVGAEIGLAPALMPSVDRLRPTRPTRSPPLSAVRPAHHCVSAAGAPCGTSRSTPSVSSPLPAASTTTAPIPGSGEATPATKRIASKSASCVSVGQASPLDLEQHDVPGSAATVPAAREEGAGQ